MNITPLNGHQVINRAEAARKALPEGKAAPGSEAISLPLPVESFQKQDSLPVAFPLASEQTADPSTASDAPPAPPQVPENIVQNGNGTLSAFDEPPAPAAAQGGGEINFAARYGVEQSRSGGEKFGFPGTRNRDLRHLRLSEPEQKKIYGKVKKNLTCFEKVTEKYKKVSEDLRAEGLKDPPSPAELAALEIYSDGDYTRINPVLRGDRMPLLDRLLYPLGIGPGVSMEGITLLCASALNKLPPFQGTVYRESRLYGDQPDQYEPGKTVKELAFTSTSSETQGAAQRMGNTLFIISSETGRAIDRFSRHPREKEVLFPPGTEFKVLGREEKILDGKPMTVILMEEAG
ncbi:MAG: ADP-ribosyltransferase domain-containing protein [Candidatus Eremiobacteraeota bacterium]|nr:ADP-ribosyltransferase domain-containing protein [Candidatus Eremiobacteraeota bacterium]